MTSRNIILPAVGYSMYPFFIPEDILYIKPIVFKKIKVNDFLTFKKRGKVITHRVIYVPEKKDYLIAKGDANLKSDTKVTERQVIGRVVKVKRKGKLFSPDSLYKMQSAFYYKEILKVHSEFGKKRINYVFLKGLPLYLYYEKGIPKRLYADCDILVDKKQFADIHKILLKLGYTRQEKHYSLFHKLLKNKETEIDYVKKFKGFSVDFDVHVEPTFMMHQIGSIEALYPGDLLERLSINMLADKRTIEVAGRVYPILGTSQLILYLALHIFHHNLSGYFRYELLNLVIKKEKYKLAEMIDLMNLYKLSNFVSPVFLLLNKYYPSAKINRIVKKLKSDFQVKQVDIFSEDSRIDDGVKRFKLIYELSPNGVFKKMSAFVTLPVLYSVGWVLFQKLHKYYRIFIMKVIMRMN